MFLDVVPICMNLIETPLIAFVCTTAPLIVLQRHWRSPRRVLILSMCATRVGGQAVILGPFLLMEVHAKHARRAAHALAAIVCIPKRCVRGRRTCRLSVLYFTLWHIPHNITHETQECYACLFSQ